MLLITRNGTDWIEAPGATGDAGPVWGFDEEHNRPVFRSPLGYWVDAMGNVIAAGNMQGKLDFSLLEHSGFAAAL